MRKKLSVYDNASSLPGRRRGRSYRQSIAYTRNLHRVWSRASLEVIVQLGQQRKPKENRRVGIRQRSTSSNTSKLLDLQPRCDTMDDIGISQYQGSLNSALYVRRSEFVVFQHELSEAVSIECYDCRTENSNTRCRAVAPKLYWISMHPYVKEIFSTYLHTSRVCNKSTSRPRRTKSGFDLDPYNATDITQTCQVRCTERYRDQFRYDWYAFISSDTWVPKLTSYDTLSRIL